KMYILGQIKKAVTEIYGDVRVEGVTLASIDTEGNVMKGSEEQLACDFVCISGGLYPLVELIALTGCPFYYTEELGGYVLLHNERMETAQKGLYVAGNITGIEGAKVAISQGRTAGLSVAANTGVNGLETDIEESIDQIANTRDNAYIQFHPDVKQGKATIQSQWNLHHTSKNDEFV